MKPAQERLEKRLTTLEGLIETLKTTPGARKSERYYYEVLKDFYQDIYNNCLSGEPIVHTGIFAPQELFKAMGIAPYSPEFDALLSMMMNPDEGIRFIDRGEATGVTKEVCSAHRMGLGMMAEAMAPPPTIVVSSSAPCDVTNFTYEIYSKRYNCPAFLIDTPYGYGDYQMAYYKKEMQSLIRFLEENTGKTLDYQKLQEMIELSSKGYEYWDKINALRKNIPNPIKSRETTRDFAVTILGAGSPIAMKFFEARYQELQEMVNQKKGVVPDEKYRITWLYVLPYFDLSIADWMEEKYGAVIVVDLFSYAAQEVDMSDTSDPMAFLAKKPYKGGLIKSAYGPYHAPSARDDFLKMCTEYHSDVVIMLAHWGCKQYCGLAKLLSDDIKEEVGLPMLILDADILDPRIVSSTRVKAKLEEFFSSLSKN
jgi:benzoyl-CoA reductase/2-hydroxyglutaryl-CoA dehydratase subunit BcrC/BadD/HgdB